MAAGIITSILKWTLDKIALSIAGSLSTPSPSALQELEQLRSMLMGIHARLDDAEERDIGEYSVTLRLAELKEVVYDAEDAVDEYDYEVLRAGAEGRRRHAEHSLHNGTQGGVCCCNPDPLQILIPDELIRRVREIRERFDEITREWGRLHLPGKFAKKRRVRTWTPRETTRLGFDGSTIFGRVAEREKVVEWLLSSNENDECNVSVLVIVGMGGMGKTTLAQIALNDLRVSQRFDLEGWVCCVSQESDPLNLIRRTATSLTGTMVPSMDLKGLHQVLNEKVKGKTFLLVLDDVWNVEVDLWKSLRTPLLGAKLGKIIVTTRSMSVAKLIHTVPPMLLTSISSKDCWLLFSKLAFEGRDPDTCKELEDIGLKIILRCKGLPLAVKTIGATLRKENYEGWLEVLESELWDLDQDNENQILPALKLSYDRMPSHLKWCFTCLCLFPKGYAFDEERIVSLWMSQGFLQPQGGKLELKIGSEYLEDLMQRSILQPYRNKKDVFVVHDLMHDLAKSVADNEYEQMGAIDVPNIKVRHLSLLLSNNIASLNFKAVLTTKHLRTLIILKDNLYAPDAQNLQIPDSLFHNLKCLRALDLMNTKIRELPGSIVSAKHLRYLCLQGTSIQTIPESICCLYNLQILDAGNTDVVELPKGIKELVNLRCLKFSVILNVCMPSGIGELTNLQELSVFNVRRGSWHCKLGELKKLVNLHGLLMIDGLTHIEYFDFSPQEAYLKTMENVEHLRLLWESSVFEIKKCTHHNNLTPEEGNVEHIVARKGVASMITNEEVAELVLESLHPHTNLRKLVINDYMGMRFASWVGEGSFSQLTSIKLSGCKNCKFLPPFGQLPFLKILMIIRMENVQRIGCEFRAHDPNEIPKAFPSLGYFYVDGMLKWEEWNGLENEDLPCLQSLTLDRCPRFIKFPKQHSFSLLTELRIRKCDAFAMLPYLPLLSRLELSGEWKHVILSSDLSCSEYFDNSLTLCCQLLPSLNELVFTRCSKLRALIGLGNFRSLNVLEIMSCRVLDLSENEKLPPEFTVRIRSSPEAKKWCQNVFPNTREVVPLYFVASTSPSFDPLGSVHWTVPDDFY